MVFTKSELEVPLENLCSVILNPDYMWASTGMGPGICMLFLKLPIIKSLLLGWFEMLCYKDETEAYSNLHVLLRII